MRPLGILLFSLSFFGNFLLGKCLYVSDQVSESICEQHQKFTEAGEIQEPVKSGSGSRSNSENDACGWYQVKNGKEAGCAASIVTFIECRIIEQRQSPDIKKKKVAKNQGTERITNGEDAVPHEFPSVVEYVEDDYQFCGGVLISNEWVVTAAHCVEENVLKPGSQLFAGGHKRNETDEENPARQKRNIVAHQSHEKYDYSNKRHSQYDIAVLKVAPPFELNDQVQVAILPDPEYRANGLLTVCGWGLTREFDGEDSEPSNTLQKVQVPVMDDETCNKTFAEHPAYDYTPSVTEDMICLGTEGGKGSCSGDSGGPGYEIDGNKQTLIGIVSWGRICGDPETPRVFTEVAYFIDWIKKHTCME